MSIFFTSGEYDVSFRRVLLAMRDRWERGLFTALITPFECFVENTRGIK